MKSCGNNGCKLRPEDESNAVGIQGWTNHSWSESLSLTRVTPSSDYCWTDSLLALKLIACPSLTPTLPPKSTSNICKKYDVLLKLGSVLNDWKHMFRGHAKPGRRTSKDRHKLETRNGQGMSLRRRKQKGRITYRRLATMDAADDESQRYLTA